jgi:hypothetical protein
MKLREIALAAVALAAPAAAQNWIQSPVNGHWYAKTTAPLSWPAAEASAVAAGGHLVSIQSAAENQWLVTTFFPSAPPDYVDYWIGLTDYPSGPWHWTSGDPLSYVNWGSAAEPAWDYGYLRVGPGQVGVWGTDSWWDPNLLFGIIELSPLMWIQSPVNGHWYAKTGTKLTWTAAESLATGLGGHLATVRSPLENAWAAGTFVTSTPFELWIGLNDIAAEGVYAWISGEPVVYIHWDANNPNGGEPEDGVFMNSLGDWDDWGLGDTAFALIELDSTDCDGNHVPDKYEIALGIGPDCLSASTANATYAELPAQVTITGSKLDAVTSVTIGGVPAQIVSQSFASMVVQPQPGDPGFPQIVVTAPTGSASVPSERWPSLGLASTGIGGTVTASLHNGDLGFFVIAFSGALFPAPLPLGYPPTWYGLLLDITTPYVILGSSFFPASGEKALVYAIPNNPGLVGTTVYVQAWCQRQSTFTYSFTNAAALAF